MAPTPQEPIINKIEDNNRSAAFEDGERVVISGMSGVYPDAHNVEELSKILYDKINPVTAQNVRWTYDHPEVCDFTGKIPTITRFDAQFFKVHYKLAENMDALGRKILEQSYQAIYDAGLNPGYFSGKKVGVYIGSCFSETEKKGAYSSKIISGFGLPGCSRTMFANRISYWLNTIGPSMAIDQACCSSLVALELAYFAIKTGLIEAAIVGGTNLCLEPHSSVHYSRIIPMCKDGKVRSFDQNASGCAKSEAINVLFLQKAKDALRVYADLVHVKCEFSCMLDSKLGPKYGFYRKERKLTEFLKSFYEQVGISPEAVEYVEAFGSAVPEADKTELDAISNVFCLNRKTALPVGSVMSNIGFTEAASGITAITKILLGFQSGKIAGNLHFEQPRADVAALNDGRIFVATDHHPFGRTYVAVNGLSLTGINAHVLLHGLYKPKDIARYKSAIPYLIFASGRHESAVDKILNNFKSHRVDPEEIALIHNIHKTSIAGHMCRGYITIDSNDNAMPESLHKTSGYFDDSPRQLWFVYSGMGSQWPGMGAQLMRIPTFAAAIDRCHQILQPKGIDIVHVITSKDKTIFDNILYSFVGIAAMQIGLTDILRELEIVPDHIIGHSVGELGCAYADGCMTAEETILAAYCRGLVSVQTPFIRGSMAAVGLGYRKIIKMCPPEIEVACHNGPESCTISGPADSMRKFVAQLTSKGIFAKEVQCSNIAYHSRYIAEAGPGLLKYLQEVMKTPRLRSKRWLSTSVPQEKWEEPIAQYSSAEYHTNNLLSSVLFEETSILIPPNAVVVEIAPHGLLQAILKRSLPESCKNISLTQRKHPDSVVLLLDAIGKLYMEGLNPKISTLYPKVEFPVSTATRSLSSLVEWNHTEAWQTLLNSTSMTKKAAIRNFIISLQDKEYDYLKGHYPRNKISYPYAAALVAVWDTLAMFYEVPQQKFSVKFEDLHFHSQPALQENRHLKLNVNILWGRGLFEVTTGDSKVMTGTIIGVKFTYNMNEIEHKSEKLLNSRDIYELLHSSDLSYSGEFRSIHSADITLSEAYLQWNGNWVTLIDGILQLNLLRTACNIVPNVERIRSLSINVDQHDKFAIDFEGKKVIPATVMPELDCTRCGGILIKNIKYNNLPVNYDEEPQLKCLSLIPDILGKFADDYLPYKEGIQAETGFTLQCAEIGNLYSLEWVKKPYSTSKGVNVKVHFAGINNVDVKTASLVTPIRQDEPSNVSFGMDFSGVTESGERVMGLMRTGAMSTKACANPELLWPVPEYWSLEEAATVPLAYLQALYFFSDRFIQPELVSSETRSVLVHGGAGALGQAVISVAQAFGYTVFTTVSDQRKKEFLKRLFPNLKDEYIGYSRDIHFCNKVLSETNGKGCHIVISGPNSEIKTASLKCVANYGIMFDVSQLKTQEEFILPMSFLMKCRSYFAVDISSLLNEKNVVLMKSLHSAIAKGISLGYVRPLSVIKYAPDEVSRAFNLVSTSKHYGRVIINLKDGLSQTQPRLTISADRCQLLVINGDLFGLQVADTLIDRGARHLHINTTRNTSQLQYKIRLWNNSGVKVVVSFEDLQNYKDTHDMLQKISKETDIESIFIIATENGKQRISNNYNCISQNLDSESRIFCPKLKYFVTISDSTDVDECTYLNRSQYNLPATLLMLQKLKQPEDSLEHGMSWRSALKAMESAVSSNQVVVSATSNRLPKPSILQQLATLADVRISLDCENNKTLKDLGVAEDSYGAVAAVLRIYYNVSLTEKQIATLTIKGYQEIEERMKNPCFEQVKGLKLFFSKTISDELLAGLECVAVPTLTSNVEMKENEINRNLSHIYIVPGLEGIYETFQPLCEPLKISALVLQPGVDILNESISELAERYVQIILKKTKLKDHFYLLGYENGVLVVLETAAILEKHGYTGTVFCIGYTPEEFKLILHEELGEYKSKEQLRNAIEKHMFTIMSHKDSSVIENVLQEASDWRLKTAACLRDILGNSFHSAQYTWAVIESAFVRIKQALEYEPQPLQLQSQLVMIRPAGYNFNANYQSKFQKNFTKPAMIHYLDTPIPHILDDPRCSVIINENLMPSVLEEFHSQNRCETYLMNFDTDISDIYPD